MKIKPTNKVIIASTIVLGLGIWLFSTLNRRKHQGEEHPEAKSVIRIPSTSNPLRNFLVNTDRDTTLILNKGSQIEIPASIFRTESGTIVQGKVEIDYREFHSLAQILLSGIPMAYDSAGMKYDFESAGMFQITGKQQGHPIFIQTGKSLKVNMASNNADALRFNQYYYDTIQHNWQFLRKDVPGITMTIGQANSPSNASTSTNASTSSNAYTSTNPSTSTQPNTKPLTFSIDVDKQKFPELAIYEKVVFTLSPRAKNFNPASAKIQWEEVTLEKTPTNNLYKLIFARGDSTVEIFASVNSEFSKDEQRYKQYQAAITAKQKHFQKDFEDNKKLISAIQAEELRKAQLAERPTLTQGAIYRTFTVEKFGIYNSDCPSNMPKGQTISLTFPSGTSKHGKLFSVYLVEPDKNNLYSLYQNLTFSFDPKTNNVLLVVFADNSIGVISSEKFKTIGPAEKEKTLALDFVTKNDYSETDIDACLK